MTDLTGHHAGAESPPATELDGEEQPPAPVVSRVSMGRPKNVEERLRDLEEKMGLRLASQTSMKGFAAIATPFSPLSRSPTRHSRHQVDGGPGEQGQCVE